MLEAGVVAGLRLAGDDPVLGVSVARGRGAAAVEVDDGADLGDAALLRGGHGRWGRCGAREVGSPIRRSCPAAMAASRVGPGNAASDGPHTGRGQVAVDLDGGLAHGHAVEGDLLLGVAAGSLGAGGFRRVCATRGIGSGIDEGLELGGVENGRFAIRRRERGGGLDGGRSQSGSRWPGRLK